MNVTFCWIYIKRLSFRNVEDYLKSKKTGSWTISKLRVWIFIATYNYPNSVTKSNCLASKFIPFCSEVNRVNLRDLCLTRSNNFKTSKMLAVSIWKILGFLEVSLWKSKTVQVFLNYSLIHLSNLLFEFMNKKCKTNIHFF